MTRNKVRIVQSVGNLPFRIERVEDGLDLAGFPTQVSAEIALTVLRQRTTASGKPALSTLILEAEQDYERETGG